jgi:acyl dehydratase
MSARADVVDWRAGTITDEALDLMHADLGKKVPFPQWNHHADLESVWHFLLGIGDDNPLWWNTEYAASAVGQAIAPPTFLYSCANGVPRPNEPYRGATGVEDWLPGVMALWSGDRWVWHQRIPMDAQISTTQELYDIREHEGKFAGRAIAHTTRTEYADGHGTVLGERFQTLIRVGREAARDRASNLDVPRPHYDAAALAGIKAQYAAEPDLRRGAEPRYFEDVNVGDSLGRLVKGPLTITNAVGWILACGSHLTATNRMAYQLIENAPGAMLTNDDTGVEDTLEATHWDDVIARKSGMARGYDFGGQRICWTAHLATDWCGDLGELVELDSRLLRPNFMGDLTWISGEVTGKQVTETGHQVTCQIRGTNQRDETTVVSTAVIRLPSRSER